MPVLQPDAPRAVRPGEELDAPALGAYLNAQHVGFGTIVEIRQFPGGYSNLTYFLKTDSGAEYVLRRPPAGAKDIKGGHDMAREYRVLILLQAAGYAKIPGPVALCEDDTVMGCPFYVMERVPGVILRAHDAPGLGLDVAALRRLSEALVDNLVALHSIDIQRSGLIALGKPEGYIRRQTEGWYRRYQAAQTDDLGAMDQLYVWLDRHMPAENTPTLIHNDYKYDNLVLNADDLSDIRAVLDWEMCTVGDPLMDVGTALSYWSQADDGPFEKTFNLSWLPGNLTRAEFAARYAEKSGRDCSNLLYYYVFGTFKNAVVLQQIYTRWKKGLTQDERFGALIQGVKALGYKALKAVEIGRI
jgi:aminoglycoside phosphotransferase (APT) family kinase protein